MAPVRRPCLPFTAAPVVYLTAVPIRLLLAEEALRRADGLHPLMVAALCSPVAILTLPPLALLVAEESPCCRAQRGRRKVSSAWLPCLAFQLIALLVCLGALALWPMPGSASAAHGEGGGALQVYEPPPLAPALAPADAKALRGGSAAPQSASIAPALALADAKALHGGSAPAPTDAKALRGGGGGSAAPASAGATAAAVGRGRISVVLPCADEGRFAFQTVKSFCDRTPAEVLEEILVVDDGSHPPMKEVLEGIEGRCRLRVLRHETTMGLMIAKQTGGDAAVGEFIGFFDCHVAPNRGWHRELVAKLQAHPRRLVVPTITDLDLDTWDEKQQSSSNSKCYISWDAEFMWFEDASDFIPVVSGGLVAISRDWWRTSGGFDKDMRGWGGENVDQSLRTWLCGGEIVRAPSSRVAHMWRVPGDRRTQSHYHLVRGTDNNARVAAAWFDDFRVKFQKGRLTRNAPDVSGTLHLKQALGCKPFAYFLHRFRRVYLNGGMLPREVFNLKSKELQRCIVRMGDSFRLGPCDGGAATRFHLGNQDPKKGGRCCSGIRLWDSLQCFDRLDPTGPLPYFCDVTGHNLNQQYRMSADGLIRHGSGRCLSAQSAGTVVAADCGSATHWEQDGAFRPQETQLYEDAIREYKFSENDPDN